MPIHVELVTQERKAFEEPEADMILVPAREGEMGILPNHAPVLTTMGYGELIVRKGQAEERFVIYGGVVDVRPDKVVVLADLAESSFNVDLEEAQAARERARKMLEEGVSEDQNHQAVLELRRAELAIKVANKMRNRPSAGGLRILDEDENP